MEVVRGYLQSYDWGAHDGLADWAGHTGGPQAELWFGTHPNGPSPRVDGSGPADVDIPILTKLLAAGRPLSIQIHPPEDVARVAYDRQQTDPDLPQLLSDPYGKAEILIAIEPFDILEGFRDPQQGADILGLLGSALRPAAQALSASDLPAAIRLLLAMDAADARRHAADLPAAMTRAGLDQHAADVMAAVVDSFPDDPGVFVASLLNARTLQPGEAVYVDPGTVHAYVRGLGLEVMNTSDNVLRLGLTSKTIAVEAALDALSLQAQPRPCEPSGDSRLHRYAPPDAPFSVDMLTGATLTADGGHARTVLCLTGTTRIGATSLRPGEAVLAAAADPALDIEAEGICVVAQQAFAGAAPTG